MALEHFLLLQCGPAVTGKRVFLGNSCDTAFSATSKLAEEYLVITSVKVVGLGELTPGTSIHGGMS